MSIKKFNAIPVSAVPEEYLIENGTYELYDCPECNGSGVIRDWYTDDEEECENCGGCGQFAVEPTFFGKPKGASV